MDACILMEYPEWDMDAHEQEEYEADALRCVRHQFGSDIDWQIEWLQPHAVGSHIAGHYGKVCHTREEIEAVNRMGGWKAMVRDVLKYEEV